MSSIWRWYPAERPTAAPGSKNDAAPPGKSVIAVSAGIAIGPKLGFDGRVGNGEKTAGGPPRVSNPRVSDIG